MATATTLRATGRGVAGSAFFIDGMNSAVDPMFVGDRAYRHAENVLNRGGVISTRPAYRQVHLLADGIAQGIQYVRPISGEGSLVSAVSGKLYQTVWPFATNVEIPGIQLYQHAPRVWMCVATRSAVRNADGTVQSTEPLRILIAQDGGFTRAAYWDGITSGHSDPTLVTDAEDNVLTKGIPAGGPMAWSGDRLWVAQGNKLFASDISDPLSFTENEYAGEGGFFAFDDDITALIEMPSLNNPVLLVFTSNRTYAIQSGIRTRSLWKDTKNFKSTLFSDIGCVSQRGVVSQNGLLWWFCLWGLTNIDVAQQAQVTSKLTPQDLEMADSKSNLWEDKSGVALGALENFLVVSVPHAHRWNTHTWVRDSATVPEKASWAGIWTGTRPIEWTGGDCGGHYRLFHLSKDEDGKNRIWQAFQLGSADNSTPIQAFVETKTHIDFSEKATGLDKKTFVFGELTFTNILGNVGVEVYWAGNYGKYKKLADYQLVATKGGYHAATKVKVTTPVGSHRAQMRVLRTPEVLRDSAAACSALGIESRLGDWIDTGFSLLIVWRGQAALRSYRIFADPFQEMETGEADFNETGPKVLQGAICE